MSCVLSHDNICPWHNKTNILWVKSNLYCEKFSENISVFGYGKALLETYSAFGRNKPEQRVMILWVGENRSEKKNVLIFFIIGRKKWKKTKCWFNPQKTKLCCFVFLLKNTNIGYHLFGRILSFFYIAKKNTFLIF